MKTLEQFLDENPSFDYTALETSDFQFYRTIWPTLDDSFFEKAEVIDEL